MRWSIIGRKFESGQGVAKSDAEALNWFRKAAELGDKYGMFYAGRSYENGLGTAKDAAEAARWYRKAADLGDTTSMRNLAGLYEKGDGVAKDAAEALRWRRAAKAPASPPGSTPIEAKSALVLAKDLSGHSDYVVAVSFSPDGKRLASGSYDSTIILWETASGNLIRKFEPGVGKVYAVAFSPDGKVLASSHTDGDIKLWDVESGRLLQSLKADTYAVYLLAFTPDGALLAGQSAFTINLWEDGQGRAQPERHIDPHQLQRHGHVAGREADRIGRQ